MTKNDDDQASLKLRLALVMLIPAEPPDYAGNLVNSLVGAFPDVRVLYRRLDHRPLWISTTPPEGTP